MQQEQHLDVHLVIDVSSSYIVRVCIVNTDCTHTTCLGEMGTFLTRGNGVSASVGHCSSRYSQSQCWPVLKYISFSRRFSSTPAVTVSISLLDSYKNRNVRVHVYPSSVTTSGFRANISKWGDTIMYIVELSWIACGN